MVSKPAGSTNVTLPYEKTAMNGEDMPDGLEYPDQILFLQLRMLYEQLKRGVVDRETALQEKKQLLTEYQAHQLNWKMCDKWCETIRNTELARAEFRKNPSLEAAEKLVAAIEGRKLP